MNNGPRGVRGSRLNDAARLEVVGRTVVLGYGSAICDGLRYCERTAMIRFEFLLIREIMAPTEFVETLGIPA